MHNLDYAKRFRKDVKKWQRSGENMKAFEDFVEIVRTTWPPPPQYEAHMLAGGFEGLWDVHLRQNWVLLLRFENGTIQFRRMGTHAELGL